MSPSSPLITNLALLFLIASFTVLIFRSLGLPSILGFLMAGLAANGVGRALGFEFSLSTLQGLSEIGLIFLLFTIGLDFSYKNLFRLRFPQFLATAVQVLVLLGLLYQVCRVLGFSSAEALFLSSAFAFCSTAIVVKTLSDLDLKGHRFLNSVFVVLLIEDLIAVLLLVNLTSYAITPGADSLVGALGAWQESLWSLVKVGAFIVTLLLAGVFILPKFFKKHSEHMTSELSLILWTGMCFFAVLVSQRFGLSAALGAFLMGTILSTLPNREALQRSFNSLRDFFSAIFFVSIGLLVEVRLDLQTLSWIALFSALIVLGKTVLVSLLHVMMGYSLKNSFYTGLSLTPIGEFSFIIAGLGLAKGALSTEAFSIVVCVAFVTSFFTPIALKKREKLLNWVQKGISEALVQKIQTYSDFSATSADQFLWVRVFKSPFVRKAIWKSLLMLGIALTGQALAGLDVFSETPGTLSWLYQPTVLLDLQFDLLNLAKLILFVFITGLFTVMALPSSSRASDLPEKLQSYYPIFQMGLSFWALAILLVSLRVLFSAEVALLGVLAALLLSLAFKRRFRESFTAFEHQIAGNLELKSLMRNAQAKVAVGSGLPDQHMVEMLVCATSDWRGKSLQQVRQGQEFKFLVPIIDRNGRRIFAPRGDEIILANDRLYVLGDEEGLIRLHQQIEDRTRLISAQDIFDELNLELFEVEEGSPLGNKTMSHPEVTKALRGIVVSIDRAQARIPLPSGQDVLMVNDRLWLLRSEA